MTDTEARFVATNAIKQAVAGREEEILDALSVDWHSGRPHIRCPYSDHPDKHPSWRWDARARKAFCSCNKGDGIFDIVAKVGGIDFDAAKIRIAELLKCDDLIRTKRGDRGRPQYQRTDAISLMSAPANKRDDTLPIAYLAYRLNVPLETVPTPVTPMIGLKALGYFDPPPRSRAKPKLVGEFPCAVFGMVGADGQTHAHRIYVAAGGAGKAELGSDPNGRPRNPKKSAKVIGEGSTAGRSVLWGDPSCAPHIVITEGIETGAAVALAFKVEIEAGAIAVAAAISATGIEAFQPYPATTRVTIAADRDEAVKSDGKPGSRRGEIAARSFGLKHHDRITVAIALPGSADQGVDWLDVLKRDGITTVRDGILVDANEFIPTPAELTADAESQRRADELAKIAADYPLPHMDTVRLLYKYTTDDRIKVHQVVKSDKGAGADQTGPLLVPIASPFGVQSRLRHADQADAFGLRCVVQDMNGKPRCVDFERGALAKFTATDIRRSLFDAGLRVEGDGETIVVQCLKAADPEREIVVVGRPGWHEFAGQPDPLFICPNGDVIGAPEEIQLELAARARMPSDVAKAGTLEGWRDGVDAALSVSGCPHWTLGITASFAGPIVALTGMDTCGIDFSGMSTSGKSTGQRLAASAWSTPDIRRAGLFQSARATDNAVEALAQRASGTVLSLDELAHINGKIAGKIIYTIAGGVGKRRMSADASLRDSYTWSTFAVLSGECSLEEKVRGDGGEWVAGMAVRIVDIDVTGTNRNVDTETLRRINEIEHHYGHAGPAFVQALIGHELHRQAPALRDRILKAARTLAGGDTADSAMIRAATPLALLLIAGELAKNFELLPDTADIRGAVQWGWDQFTNSTDAAALDPENQTIANLRGWIAERWDVTIKPTEPEDGASYREAVGWYDHDTIYIPKHRIREAAGNGLKQSQIGALLHRRNLLAARPEPDRYYVRWVPGIGKIEAYALLCSEFGRATAFEVPIDFNAYKEGRR